MYSEIKSCLVRLLLFAAILIPTASFGQHVTIIYDKNNQYQSRFLKLLSTQLAPQQTLTLSAISADLLSIPNLDKAPIDLIVNLDNETTQSLISSNVETTFFHALTTLSRAKKFVSCLPNCKNKHPNHYFFVLDQPAFRQLKLIQLINPNYRKIGVLATPQSKDLITKIKRIASLNKLIINDYVSNTTDVRYQIDDVSKSSDIILATADTGIYNTASLSQILLTSYRYKTPIIGFSKGFIKAGALAGSVSNIEQLAQHLAEQILQFKTANDFLFDSIIYPRYFDVLSNRNVAKSLNLHFPDDVVLKAQLMADESS